MATTLFYTFVISFADATAAETPATAHADHTYRISEAPPGHWTLAEDGQPLELNEVQRAELAHMLAALHTLPDPTITPAPPGSDGTWITVRVRRDSYQHAYRWWVNPPPGWDVLGGIAQHVQRLADLPRQALAARHHALISRFYASFAGRDAAGMIACYHPDIHFGDPIFDLRGAEAGAMWQMLFSRATAMRVVYDDIRADHEHGSAHWEATYPFSATGRTVHNVVSAQMSFADGAIIAHTDRFDFQGWAVQAFGPLGRVLGGFAFFQQRIKTNARAQLAAFMRAQQQQR